MSKITDNLKNRLNKNQAEAASVLKGPVLVLAGAGTGKTRVITYRIANMLDSGIKPEHIAGMTFTNKAAREMKERLLKLCGSAAEKVFLGTFHSFCARLLRREISALGYNKNFSIIDESDQAGLLKQIMAEMSIQKDKISSSLCIALISKVKSELLQPEELRIRDAALDSVFVGIYQRYQKMLKNQNVVDFDDLLYLTLQLFEKDSAVLEKYRGRYRHLLVDEYQDTNFLQFRLLELLAGSEQNLFVVGDDDQSIYGWRGAQIENILNFPQHFPGTKQIKLEQNYRSTNAILEASNALIAKNAKRHGKELWSEQGRGDDLKCIKADCTEQEAGFIVDSIVDMVGGKDNIKYNDIAVLYRSNYLSRHIEDALRNSHLPYRLIGSRSFYERKEVRDAVAYLRLIVNPRDDQSLLRILKAPPRGLGDKAIEKLRELQSATYMPMLELLANPDFLAKVSSTAAAGARELTECISKWRSELNDPAELGLKTQTYLKECGFIPGLIRMYKDRAETEKRQDNVMELVHAVCQYENKNGRNASLSDFLELYALVDDNDKVDEEQEDSVTLMTVHAAKGLEFPVIFIVGVEENVFPNERALLEGGLEEERRLFYVALTRAKLRVIITRSRERMRFGKTTKQRPSKFIDELPEGLLDKKHASEAFKKVSIEALEKAFENFTL